MRIIYPYPHDSPTVFNTTRNNEGKSPYANLKPKNKTRTVYVTLEISNPKSCHTANVNVTCCAANYNDSLLCNKCRQNWHLDNSRSAMDLLCVHKGVSK